MVSRSLCKTSGLIFCNQQLMPATRLYNIVISVSDIVSSFHIYLNKDSTWRSRSEMADQKLRCGAQGCGFETPEVDIAIAMVLLQYHNQDDHAQVGAGDGGGEGTQGARQATDKSTKKPDRASLDMDTAEGVTCLEDLNMIRDELRAYIEKHQARVVVRVDQSVDPAGQVGQTL